VAQLRREQERFSETGGQVVLVSMGDPDEAETFRRAFSIPFPIICDSEKALYAAFDLKGANLGHIFSPRMFFRGLKTVSQGHLPGIPRHDLFQLSGAAVIDRSGLIRFFYASRDPSDHPSVSDILKALTSLS
jgi:peroxiredoxin